MLRDEVFPPGIHSAWRDLAGKPRRCLICACRAPCCIQHGALCSPRSWSRNHVTDSQRCCVRAPFETRRIFTDPMKYKASRAHGTPVAYSPANGFAATARRRPDLANATRNFSIASGRTPRADAEERQNQIVMTRRAMRTNEVHFIRRLFAVSERRG